MMQSPPSSPNSSDGLPIPSDIPYSEHFTDELMRAILNPSSSTGTEVFEKNSASTANGNKVRLEDATTPNVEPTELPLPLDDSRRSYRSHIPGVKLTHPGGMLQGGPPAEIPSGALGSDGEIPQDVRRYAEKLIKTNKISSATELRTLIRREAQGQVQELKKQMQDRSDAIEENERIRKEIKQKEAERATERRIEEKMRQQATKSRRDS